MPGLTTSDPATLATAAQAILRGLETGKYQPFLDRISPSQIAEVHRYLDSYDCVGKTVVLPGPVGARVTAFASLNLDLGESRPSLRHRPRDSRAR